MTNDVIVSTTSQIAGWQVDDHVDIVSAHIVTGANIFQDVFASFRDIFGGQARSYQEKLAEIDEGVVEILKDKAHE